jgi:hypothetical protein
VQYRDEEARQMVEAFATATATATA